MLVKSTITGDVIDNYILLQRLNTIGVKRFSNGISSVSYQLALLDSASKWTIFCIVSTV